MNQQVVEYNITDAAISKMENLYMGLTITDIKNDEEFTAVHDARMVVKNHRVSVEKKRKELKAEALAWGKKVDGEANRIKGLLEPIENHLASEENKVTAEKARIKAEQERIEKEKIQDRIDKLFAVNVVMPFMDVATMTDEEYEDKLILATDAYRTEQQKLEEERKAKEEEEARLVAERAEIERIKTEQEARAREQAEKEAALKAEKERLDRIEFERKAKEEATIQAEVDAKAKIEKETREKEEAEKAERLRVEALLPDKAKLEQWIDGILSIPEPKLSNKKAKELLEAMVDGISQVLATYQNKIKKL